MLILEDIDTIVTPGSRSYFFNEVDGLESNDGIFLVSAPHTVTSSIAHYNLGRKYESSRPA